MLGVVYIAIGAAHMLTFTYENCCRCVKRIPAVTLDDILSVNGDFIDRKTYAAP